MRPLVTAGCSIGCLAALAISISPASAASPPATAQLKTQMHESLSALLALQPLLASPAAFDDAANRPRLDAHLVTLSRLEHQFSPRATATGAVMAQVFGSAVEQARADLRSGRTNDARMRLRGLTTLCSGCHTRKLSPGDFAQASAAADGAGLEPLERAQFLAATRQFDAALALWRELLRAPATTEAHGFEQAQALRAALGVAVRAKDDPAVTVQLLEAQLERTDLPASVRRSLSPLLAEATAWKREAWPAAAQTPQALFDKGRALVDAANAVGSVLPREEHRISLLRATAYLTLALDQQPRAKWRGEALYLLGAATGAAADPALWDLDGVFLEACVREGPHTAIAAQCYDLLAERTFFGFTGSGGTRVPPEVAAKLDALKALATPRIESR